MKTLMVTVAVLMAWATAMAAEAPSIIQGFGKTKWGQTKQEVAALVTLSPVRPPANPRGGPDIVAVGDGPIDRVAYYFTHDRLVWVDAYIALPAEVEPSIARAAIQEVIDAKYGDKDSVVALRASGITIETEQDPQQGGKGVCVRYWNHKLEKETERQELDRRKKEAQQAVKQMGLDRLLWSRATEDTGPNTLLQQTGYRAEPHVRRDGGAHCELKANNGVCDRLGHCVENLAARWILAGPGHVLQGMSTMVAHLAICIALSAICVLALRRHVTAIPVAVVVSIGAFVLVDFGPPVAHGDLSLSALLFWMKRSPAFRDAIASMLPMTLGGAIGTWFWFHRPRDKQPNEQVHGTADVCP